MQRVKQYGSSLHNVSKKRLAEIESGMFKQKPKKALRHRTLDKQKKWNKARAECLKRWKGLDALTLQPINEPWDCHHAFKLAQHCYGEEYFNQLNLVPIVSRIHRRHSQGDKLFYNWQEIIRNNAKKIGVETL